MVFRFRDDFWDLTDRRTRVMGVLNVTPDSFSDGGRCGSVDAAVEHGLRMTEEGADVVDVGGESTRPGSEPVSAAEELARVIPVITALRRQTSVPISIDSSKSEVAERALEAGASIINDVTAGTRDPRMTEVAARARAGLILMHMQGTPRTMQASPGYQDVVREVREYLAARVLAAREAGCAIETLMIDPGIGFGKSLQDNLRLLKGLAELLAIGRPVAVGTSRKSFIGAITGQERAAERIEGTIASCLHAASRGAACVRVHDVAAVRMALAVWAAIEAGSQA